MKLIHGVLRSVNVCLYNCSHPSVRAFSIFSNPGTNDNQSNNVSRLDDDFFKAIDGGIGGTSGDLNSSLAGAFDKIRNQSEIFKNSGYNLGNRSKYLDDLDDSNTLSDGMDDKLKKAATFFEIDEEEVEDEEFAFRPDVTFQLGNTYDSKDLDLTRPGVNIPRKNFQFEVTSKEVMKQADFRNVRFLTNFITDAGIIIRRDQTKISAKAQRKVAREIKTARAFGLMPFTTMGTKRFVFGRTMEAENRDFEYFVNDDPVATDTVEDPPVE